jgi:hypothetical protein
MSFNDFMPFLAKMRKNAHTQIFISICNILIENNDACSSKLVVRDKFQFQHDCLLVQCAIHVFHGWRARSRNDAN